MLCADWTESWQQHQRPEDHSHVRPVHPGQHAQPLSNEIHYPSDWHCHIFTGPEPPVCNKVFTLKLLVHMFCKTFCARWIKTCLCLTWFYSFSLQEFVINSPDFEAAKFWIGNLGKTATHAVVYAQLYTPDKACHGLHSFVVPVRIRPLEKSFSNYTRNVSTAPVKPVKIYHCCNKLLFEKKNLKKITLTNMNKREMFILVTFGDSAN